MPNDIQALLEPVIAIAKQAGREILEIYEQSRQFPIHAKADHSPLTQADIIAHEVITQELQKLTPALPILSEEGSIIDFSERQHWQRYWSVDPVDGTLEFIRHSGEFTVNIALIESHRPILGVIFIPVTGECYYATPDGAYKKDVQGNLFPLKVRPWQSEHTVILASYGVKEDRLQRRIGYLGAYDVIKVGSSWKFCLLAEGKGDIYPRMGDTCEWDTAAGQCILERAGGAVLDLNGQPLRYNTRATLLNPHFVALGDYRALVEKIDFDKFNVN